MTDEQKAFAETARELASMLHVSCRAMGLDQDQTANLLTAAAGQALITMFGPLPAAERMRLAADKMERSMLLQLDGRPQ